MSVFNKNAVFGADDCLDFSIRYQQFLDSQGKVIKDLPPELSDKDEVIKAYKTMVLIRAFDQKAIALQRTGRLGTYPSVLGQEAIGTAIGMAMHADDVFAPYYRDFATQYLRGVSLNEMLTYWGGSERGSAYADCPADFPVCVPIATQFGHAAGAAIALKTEHAHRASVVTCGDGATSKGDFLETLNLAGAWQLPLVMVVNNNQWAISTPRQIQTGSQTIAQKAIAAGIDGIVVDGNDYFALRHELDRALQKAYAGKGATLIEAMSYRLSDHTTADDASRYRNEEELNLAWQQEPVKRLKNYITQTFGWTETDEQALVKEVKTKVNDAVKTYSALPEEPAEAMFDYLFEELPKPLLSQYAQVKAKSLLTTVSSHSITASAEQGEEVSHE